MFTRENRIIVIGLFVVLLLVDQATKSVILIHFAEGQRYDLFPFFSLTLVFNEGVGLSMFSFLYDWTEVGSQLFFGLLNVLISVGILYFYRGERPRVPVVGWTMVVSGALGNAFDRFMTLGTDRTGVVDFIWVYWPGVFNFPVINVADIAITLGFAMVLVNVFFANRPATAVSSAE